MLSFQLKGEKTDLTSTSGPRDPKVIRISEDTVALSRDKDLVFVEINGLQPSFKRIITWSDAPIVVGVCLVIMLSSGSRGAFKCRKHINCV